MTLEETTELRAYIISKRMFIDNNGCWLRNSKKDKSLYATASYRGKIYVLSRLALAAWKQMPLDSRFQACHTCDIPGCFNPEHLFTGTPGDNRKDMEKKYRRLRFLPYGDFRMAFARELDRLLIAIGI